MLAWVALLIALAGLLMWALGRGAKVTEAGRILFFCGVFVVTWQFGTRTIRLF